MSFVISDETRYAPGYEKMGAPSAQTAEKVAGPRRQFTAPSPLQEEEEAEEAEEAEEEEAEVDEEIGDDDRRELISEKRESAIKGKGKEEPRVKEDKRVSTTRPKPKEGQLKNERQPEDGQLRMDRSPMKDEELPKDGQQRKDRSPMKDKELPKDGRLLREPKKASASRWQWGRGEGSVIFIFTLTLSNLTQPTSFLLLSTLPHPAFGYRL